MEMEKINYKDKMTEDKRKKLEIIVECRNAGGKDAKRSEIYNKYYCPHIPYELNKIPPCLFAKGNIMVRNDKKRLILKYACKMRNYNSNSK